MSKGPVCVTGASGFIGSHVVEAFLSRGYAVVAAVRNPADKKNAFLDALRDKYAGNGSSLRVSAGDLTKPGSHDDAIKGCKVVVHVAAVVKDNYEKDPFVEIINPSVEGTRDIVATCKRHGVRRLVATSSVATIRNKAKKGTAFPPWNEDDTNDFATPYYDTYSYSKREAENVLKSEWDGELVTIHPSLVLGPVMDASVRTSVQIVISLCNREFPRVPPIWFDWVDVRDVAEAHVMAVENPAAKGRYIMSRGEPQPILGFAKILSPLYPNLRIPTASLPWALMWVASWWDKRLTGSFLYERCVRIPGYSMAKIEKELGFKAKFTDLTKSLVDTVTSLQKFKVVAS